MQHLSLKSARMKSICELGTQVLISVIPSNFKSMKILNQKKSHIKSMNGMIHRILLVALISLCFCTILTHAETKVNLSTMSSSLHNSESEFTYNPVDHKLNEAEVGLVKHEAYHGRRHHRMRAKMAQPKQTDRSAITIAATTTYVPQEGQVPGILPPRPTVYHATDAQFTSFRQSLTGRHRWFTWFSPDPLDSFRLAVANTYLKKQNDRSAVIYVHQCHATTDWNLYNMSPLESESRQRLIHDLGMEFGKVDVNKLLWYGRTAEEADLTTGDFCFAAKQSNLHGWRNAWDQNEVMLCDPRDIVTCSGGWQCDSKGLMMEVDSELNKAAPYRTDTLRDTIGGGANRFNYVIFPRGTFGTFDEQVSKDVASLLFNKYCQPAPDLFVDTRTTVTEKKTPATRQVQVGQLPAVKPPPSPPRPIIWLGKVTSPPVVQPPKVNLPPLSHPLPTPNGLPLCNVPLGQGQIPCFSFASGQWSAVSKSFMLNNQEIRSLIQQNKYGNFRWNNNQVEYFNPYDNVGWRPLTLP